MEYDEGVEKEGTFLSELSHSAHLNPPPLRLQLQQQHNNMDGGTLRKGKDISASTTRRAYMEPWLIHIPTQIHLHLSLRLSGHRVDGLTAAPQSCPLFLSRRLLLTWWCLVKMCCVPTFRFIRRPFNGAPWTKVRRHGVVPINLDPPSPAVPRFYIAATKLTRGRQPVFASAQVLPTHTFIGKNIFTAVTFQHAIHRRKWSRF